MASDLLKSSLEGKNVKVPIGQPIVTNTPSQNSLSIQQIMTGRPLVAPDVNQLDVSSFDGKDLTAQQDRLRFTDPVVLVNDKRVVRWAFDDTSGRLVGIRVDGTQIEIVGFLRQIDFGIGPTGPRGNPGRDGVDGKDGIDGEKGVRGQPGIMGPHGAAGYQGNDGIDGPMGATGPVGLQGITGPTGPRGSEGMAGMEGKRGDKGFNCPATLRGPTGPTGKTMSPLVGLKKGPTAHELIFAAGTEDDCGCDIPCNFEPPPSPAILVSQKTVTRTVNCPPGTTVSGKYGGDTSYTISYLELTYSDGTVISNLVTNGAAPFCAVPPRVEVSRRLVEITKTCPNGQTVFGKWKGTNTYVEFHTELTYSDGTKANVDYGIRPEGATCSVPVEPPFMWVQEPGYYKTEYYAYEQPGMGTIRRTPTTNRLYDGAGKHLATFTGSVLPYLPDKYTLADNSARFGVKDLEDSTNLIVSVVEGGYAYNRRIMRTYNVFIEKKVYQE